MSEICHWVPGLIWGRDGLVFSLPHQIMRVRVNGQITASPVRVVSEDGSDLGVHSITDALNLVQARREDLVEIEPEAVPPVCQTIDFGKFQYRLQQSGKKKGRY
jgi:translation initiation factor IF-3